MAVHLIFYDDTDTTQQTATIPAGSVDGGTTYTQPLVHVWNDNGGVLGDTLTATGVTVYAGVLIGGVEYLSGSEAGFAIPVLDQRWIGVQVTGANKVGDSTMEDQTTAIMRIGANQRLVLKDIPKNCARFIQPTLNVPSGAANQPFDVILHVDYADSAITLPLDVGALCGSGVLPDWLDASARRLTRGAALVASGTANVDILNGSLAYDGSAITKAKETVTPNQTASDGALASGQKYIARLSRPKTGPATVTKSVKGAAPAKPAVPANEINLGCVNVAYQSGGTSIINTADLDVTDVFFGEFLVTDGGSLNARVGAGNAISSADTSPFAGSPRLVALADNATNTVWLTATGSLTSNTTDASPGAGAQRLAYVVTASGAITSITDARVFVGRQTQTVVLRKSGAVTATAADVEWGTADFDAVIERVDMELGVLGTSASGSFIGDITTRPAGTDLGTAGTSIYTSSGTDDYRPNIAYNAASLRAATVGHEVTAVSRGDRIAANVAAVPATPSVNPSDLFFYVRLRRR